MGKKKPSNATRGFSTVSIPSTANASKAKAIAETVSRTESAGRSAGSSQPSDPPRTAFRTPNPVAPKLKRHTVGTAERELSAKHVFISNHMANFAKDVRIARLPADLIKQRNQALENSVVVKLSSFSESLLVSYLLATVGSNFKLGSKVVLDTPPTVDQNKLMRDLNLVYVTCHTHLGIANSILHPVMSAARAPWDLTCVLHTLCLTTSAEYLPDGWTDKEYEHQLTITQPPLSAQSNRITVSKTTHSDKQSVADLDLDLDHLNVFDLPASTCVTPATYKTPQVLSFDITGWTGKVPKQLLRDILVRELKGNLTIKYPDAVPEKGSVTPSTSAFRVRCVINGQSYVGPAFCKTKLEAEHYAAVMGLRGIAKGRPLYQSLPQAYRDVWLDLDREEKNKILMSTLDGESPKVEFLQSLTDKIKAEGLMGPDRVDEAQKSSLPQDNTLDQAPGTNTYQPNDHLNNPRHKPSLNNGPQRRNMRIQEQRLALPVADFQAEITVRVNNNQVVLICGETGSGKTTQVPQFILEDLIKRGVRGQIFCTQPRRISATSIAARVSKEWGSDQLGDTIGFSVKLENKMSSRTRLVFCTTGILLRKLETSPRISNISHVIIDEVHERSLDSDFLLVMLKRLLVKRRDLRLVLMSATINEQQFSNYFNRCPIISIPGRTFPVTTFYVEDMIQKVGYKSVSRDFQREVKLVKRETGGRSKPFFEEQISSFPEDSAVCLGAFEPWVRDIVCQMDPTTVNYELIELVVKHIMTGVYDQGDLGAVVVFLPGIAEIRSMVDRLRHVSNVYPLPLHSTLSQSDQAHVFQPAPRGMRKVVLSTNIAETGVTIPDAVFVIDSGKARIMRYDEKKHLTRLQSAFITQANCRQRKGRAGRIRPGFYFAMYSQYRHDHQMAEYEMPEVQRIALESTTLKIKVHRFEDIVGTFHEFLDPPVPKRVQASIERLKESRALDEDLNLTALGWFLGELPLDIELGKILAYGAFYGCIDTAVCITAYLSVSLQLFNARGSITQDLINGRSDLLTAAHIYKSWKALRKGPVQQKFCDRHGLNAKSLVILDDTCGQLRDLLPVDYTWCNRHTGCVELVHTALLAASYPKILRLDPDGKLKSGVGGVTVTVHGGSIFADELAGVSSLAPFFCYFTCIHSTQLLVFDVSRIHPLLMAFAVGCQYPLDLNYVAQTLVFDKEGVGKVRIVQKTLAHLAEFHTLLTQAFDRFLMDPGQSARSGVGEPVDVLESVLTSVFPADD